MKSLRSRTTKNDRHFGAPVQEPQSGSGDEWHWGNIIALLIVDLERWYGTPIAGVVMNGIVVIGVLVFVGMALSAYMVWHIWKEKKENEAAAAMGEREETRGWWMKRAPERHWCPSGRKGIQRRTSL